MEITPALLEAFLKCPTKCWLRSQGESDTGNEYANWVKSQNESYRIEAAKRVTADIPTDERAASPPLPENLKSAKWRFAVDVAVNTENMGSTLHAVERNPSEGRGKAATFIPIRFIFRNKLARDDKLLLGFDALLLSEVLGRDVGVGKIVHGDNYATLKVKTSAMASELRKRAEAIGALLSSSTPPGLVLNRHCGECEFQIRCRQKAVEKHDLSLLSGMSEKERKKLHSKGIFTVTQLSYTFRPRRRPKRLRDKKEKYHHALKALAIREKKIHIVGTPELKIDGTPVFLDVEGLPDRDFYYLIGVRIGSGETAVQHSFWADTVEDEGKTWREFLATLETIENPVLIHYGSYETNFLRKMCERYGQPAAESVVVRAIGSAVNVLSLIFAQVYFPTYSNGLKDVARSLGFCWSDPSSCGLRATAWRHEWERTGTSASKEQLLEYNAEDCEALECVAGAFMRLGASLGQKPEANAADHIVVQAEPAPYQKAWSRFRSPLPEFEQVNNAARWDYQRHRVYARSSKHISQIGQGAKPRNRHSHRLNKTVICPTDLPCPKCKLRRYHYLSVRTRVLHDIFFGRNNVKKRVVKYRYCRCWCPGCQVEFGAPAEFWAGSKYGRNLVSYLIYQCVDLGIPQHTVARSINRLFGFTAIP